MEKIAVDVGSGLTKVRFSSGRVDAFPSVVGGFTESQRGFGVDPMVMEVKSSRLVHAGRYVFGAQAETVVAPEQRANTLSADWSGSDAWGVLLLAAVAQSFPAGYEGAIEVATGVPQAIYSARRDDVAARMTGQHDYMVGNSRYAIEVTPTVLPQAAAAVLASDGLHASTGAHGVVDVGTFTTGMAVVFRKTKAEPFSVQYWRCGGVEIGASKVAQMIGEAVMREYGGRPEEFSSHAAIQTKRMFIRGEEKDISKIVDHAIGTVSSQIVEMVSKLWPHGGMDLIRIDLVGGGAPLLEGPLKEAFPQTRMVSGAQWAIVNGLYLAIDQKVE